MYVEYRLRHDSRCTLYRFKDPEPLTSVLTGDRGDMLEIVEMEEQIVILTISFAADSCTE